MRLPHGCPPFRAVADDYGPGYHVAMMTIHPIHHRTDTAPPRDERRGNGRNDAHVITKKALERWENEGGKIPELHPGNGRNSLTRAERF